MNHHLAALVLASLLSVPVLADIITGRVISIADGDTITVLDGAKEQHKGIEKSLRSLKQQIADAPDENIGFFDNWGSNKAEKSEEAFRRADESFHTCLLGIQTLAPGPALL